MGDVLQKEVLEALRRVNDPGRGPDIVSLGMVTGLQVTADGHVIFMIEVDPARGSKLEPMRQAAEKAAASVRGVKKVTAVLTAQKPPANDPHGMDKNPRLELPIKNIIAVASGKGGVGKSTVALNLAVALAKAGKRTGLLDADIYGPSVPKMSGLEGQKPEQGVDGKLIPLEAFGLKVMSIGFMLDNEAPLVWRGPMVQTAVYQMLRDVAWGTDQEPLDVLIVDMPPGTGDAQLTLAQKVPVTGAVIVSTPQDIALIDARKAVGMFEKVGVKILGIIENMSTHVCSNCGHEEHIFGHGGARKEAEKLGVPFLGEIPLDIAIREGSDAGRPVAGNVFSQISEIVIASVAKQSSF
ncbi:MAG: Mrp/NBP35 family ATP-binding protein [Alphaproteobacteria bacterium]